jgi:hypothetical protein
MGGRGVDLQANRIADVRQVAGVVLARYELSPAWGRHIDKRFGA